MLIVQVESYSPISSNIVGSLPKFLPRSHKREDRSPFLNTLPNVRSATLADVTSWHLKCSFNQLPYRKGVSLVGRSYVFNSCIILYDSNLTIVNDIKLPSTTSVQPLHVTSFHPLT